MSDYRRYFNQLSENYRRGMNDFNLRREFDKSMVPGTFRHYDYNEGWHAAYNEMYWTAVAENKNHLYHEK